MRILLLGEYSNVHATLARGLRALGHEVVVASNGDFWKNYPRDLDLAREPGKWGGMKLIWKLWRNKERLKGYDVVQLINPMCVELKAEWCMRLYRWLKRHNKRVVLGAYGMDYYWVHENITRKPLRYSDFNIGNELRQDEEATRERRDWLGTSKERLNRYIAETCDGIVAGLYEYWVCYEPCFPKKTTYIPFPIEPKTVPMPYRRKPNNPVRIFIGISRGRSVYKGTGIMLQAAEDISEKYPQQVDLRVVEGVPFEEYVNIMRSSDLILDQLYSYTPAMNALEAMSQGIICVGGGEEEHYSLLNEKELRPIVNVEPNYQSVFNQLEQLVLHPERIEQMKRESLLYVVRHHDYIKVAKQYVEFWNR